LYGRDKIQFINLCNEDINFLGTKGGMLTCGAQLLNKKIPKISGAPLGRAIKRRDLFLLIGRWTRAAFLQSRLLFFQSR
jgi:hypothetical protein